MVIPEGQWSDRIRFQKYGCYLNCRDCAMLSQGSDGDQFYVIQQGEVMIVDASGKELSRKGPKDYFGELSLLKNEPRAATVRAVTPTSVLSLNR